MRAGWNARPRADVNAHAFLEAVALQHDRGRARVSFHDHQVTVRSLKADQLGQLWHGIGCAEDQRIQSRATAARADLPSTTGRSPGDHGRTHARDRDRAGGPPLQERREHLRRRGAERSQLGVSMTEPRKIAWYGGIPDERDQRDRRYTPPPRYLAYLLPYSLPRTL